MSAARRPRAETTRISTSSSSRFSRTNWPTSPACFAHSSASACFARASSLMRSDTVCSDGASATSSSKDDPSYSSAVSRLPPSSSSFKTGGGGPGGASADPRSGESGSMRSDSRAGWSAASRSFGWSTTPSSSPVSTRKSLPCSSASSPAAMAPSCAFCDASRPPRPRRGAQTPPDRWPSSACSARRASRSSCDESTLGCGSGAARRRASNSCSSLDATLADPNGLSSTRADSSLLTLRASLAFASLSLSRIDAGRDGSDGASPRRGSGRRPTAAKTLSPLACFFFFFPGLGRPRDGAPGGGRAASPSTAPFFDACDPPPSLEPGGGGALMAAGAATRAPQTLPPALSGRRRGTAVSRHPFN